MKRLLSLSLLSCALIVTGCSSTRNGGDNRQRQTTQYGARYGYQGEQASDQALVETQATVTETVQQSTPQTTPPPERQTVDVKPSIPPPTRKDQVYAKPVPGKPGHVFSPYAPNSGIVDVRGYESGETVIDPYTQKYFLVP